MHPKIDEEVDALRKHWRGPPDMLELQIKRLLRPIGGDDVERAFHSALVGAELVDVEVLQRFAKYFDCSERWQDSGVVAIARHFMGDELDIGYLDKYITLLYRRTSNDTGLLDAVYEATMQQSKLRLYVMSLRIARKSPSLLAASTAALGQSRLASDPALNLRELENLPPSLREILARL
jgi:hypothetical protein